MLDNLLLWNYCLSAYLVGIKNQSKYIIGAKKILLIELWYILLILIMIVLVSSTYTFSLYSLVVLVVVSWFFSYVIIGKWIDKYLKRLCVKQCYSKILNKKAKTWIGFIILISCWLSFVIVAFTVFVGYSLREYS